jgi:hypothetical protein
MAATAERQRPELLVTAAMPELAAMAVTAATVSLPELIQTQEMAAMLALVVMAVTAVRQRPELLAMVATEPMLARPETADLRQAAATAPTAATVPAVATEARAVVPLASTATAVTVDLHRTEESPVTLERRLEHWAVAAATAGLREQLVAPLEILVQVQEQREPVEPWELKAMVATAVPAGPQPKQLLGLPSVALAVTAEVQLMASPVAVAPVEQQPELAAQMRWAVTVEMVHQRHRASVVPVVPVEVQLSTPRPQQPQADSVETVATLQPEPAELAVLAVPQLVLQVRVRAFHLLGLAVSVEHRALEPAVTEA